MESPYSIWGIHERFILSAYPASDLGSRVTLSLALHTLTVLSCVLIPKSFYTFFAFAYVFPFVLNTFSLSDLLGEILFIFHNPIRTSPPLGRLPNIIHLFLFCNTSVLYTDFHYYFATCITCFSVCYPYSWVYRGHDCILFISILILKNSNWINKTKQYLPSRRYTLLQ